MNETFIYIFRRLKYWEWFHKSEMVHLWVYLLIEASIKDKTWKGFNIKRGQIVTKQERICNETGLSRQTVRTCLKRLILTKEITINTTNKTTKDFTLITICNYDDYQAKFFGTNQETNQETNQRINIELTKEQPKINQELTISNKDNKVNKVNNEEIGSNPTPTVLKKQFLEFVFLTDNEYQKLVTQYGEQDTQKMIEKLNAYKGTYGKKTKSDFHAISYWVKEWLKEEKDKESRAAKIGEKQPQIPPQMPKVEPDYSKTSFY